MDKDQKFLINFIQSIVPIADQAAENIARNFTPLHLEKNSFLLKQGQVCNEYIFLEKGFIRAYTLNTAGDEVTTNFYEPSSVVFEVASYFKRTPTQENIQALTTCMAWQGNYENFQVLFHTIPEFREFGRAILVNGFIALKERTLAMITYTAEQRYEQLLKVQPEILQIVPLKYIASYLGITDTSLSRIRKEYSKK